MLGVMDRTYVNIKNKNVYRHPTYSMNMMAVCNEMMVFMDVMAKYPRSYHEAPLWSESQQRELFPKGEFPMGGF